MFFFMDVVGKAVARVWAYGQVRKDIYIVVATTSQETDEQVGSPGAEINRCGNPTLSGVRPSPVGLQSECALFISLAFPFLATPPGK